MKFDNKKRGQVKELVGYKDIMLDMTNISVIEDDNHLLFKNNIEYIWVIFI